MSVAAAIGQLEQESHMTSTVQRHARKNRWAYATSVLTVASLAILCQAQTTAPSELDAAIETMRGINADALSQAEQQSKGEDLTKAWATLTAAGQAGVDRLKVELRAIDESKAQDDFFKLGAASLLWEIQKIDSADTITAIWRDTPLHVQYQYVFYTAFEAAVTGDPRVLPMLEPLLRDDQASAYIAPHAMDVSWPLSVEFVWGVFGPQGQPTLLKVLRDSTDTVARRSAVILLTEQQCIEALPIIRQLAIQAKDAERHLAVQSLGVFGHPDDYDLLIRGLGDPEAETVAAHAAALADYGDQRAATHLIPLLKAEEEIVRGSALYALAMLMSPDSLAALHEYATSGPSEDERAQCQRYVAHILGEMNLEWEAFAQKSPEDQQALLRSIDQREVEFQLKPHDKELTHDQLLEACREWTDAGRITGGKYAWAESRHVLAAATPQDLDLLLNLRAALYRRLSDECLYEVETVDEVLSRLGRRRYRQNVGVCAKVEPPESS